MRLFHVFFDDRANQIRIPHHAEVREVCPVDGCFTVIAKHLL